MRWVRHVRNFQNDTSLSNVGISMLYVDNGSHQIYGEVNINYFRVRIQITSGATVNVIRRVIGLFYYRPSAPFLYEVASHVKKLPFWPLLLILLICTNMGELSQFCLYLDDLSHFLFWTICHKLYLS